jgi:Fe-S cluster assembly protein SufD
MDLKEKLLTEFKTYESKLNGSASGIVHNTKLDAKKYFELLGFPHRKMEDWRFTNINSIISNDYRQIYDVQSLITEKDASKFLIPGLKANILFFINGKFVEKYSKIITNNDKVFIGTFKKAKEQKYELVEKYFAKFADYKLDGFTALNTAFSLDGVLIHIGKNIELKEPIVIINVADSKQGEIIFNPRNLIVADENSSASVIELYESNGNNFSFSNAVTEIYANKNSELHYYKIQDENDKSFHVGTTQVQQEQDSRLFSVTVSWGGSVTRNNLNSYLGGEGIECIMKGLFIGNGNQQIDNHTLADHANPNCHSNELYKGIMNGNSNGVFNGKIMVRKDAQKTNAYQMNNNILLTKDASVNSKPQLEIYADDVKCSHGATTGQLDKEQLFYLKARGIGEKEGIKLLLYAFANEVIEEVKIDKLKEYLQNILALKLNEN